MAAVVADKTQRDEYEVDKDQNLSPCIKADRKSLLLLLLCLDLSF